MIAFIISSSVIVNGLYSKNHPAYTLEPFDCVDGYIVKSVVNGTQIYGTLPNDDTVYLITLSADYLSFEDFFTLPSREWFHASNVQTINNY